MQRLKSLLEDPHDLEIAVFLALIALFEAWERLRPARAVDRRRNLRFDILCFGLALLLNRASTHSVEAVSAAVMPSFALDSLHHLRELPGWGKILLALVLVDFSLYWLHRAQHHFGFLWRTHEFHHSVDQLWWFTGFRTSFLHSLLYNVPQVVVPMFVLQLSPLEAGIGFGIGVLVQMWEHSNVDVDLGPARFVLITPKYHRIHHAALEPKNKNFAPIFSLWDLCFGTFVDPRSMPRDFPLGLGEPVDVRRVPRMVVGV